jgi:hypothetical protein
VVRADGECLECDQLWQRFAYANEQLSNLIDEKYVAVDGHINPALEQMISHAIRDRQRAKQSLLMHERDRHPSSSLARRRNSKSSSGGGLQ